MKLAFLIILSLIPAVLLESAEKTSAESTEAERTKRSGGAAVGNIIQSLQKSAFGASAALSQGSASSVAGLSGASSGGSSSSHDSHSYDHDFDGHTHDSKGFDGWSLKKSIINTLLQAVKAIAGGVTTLQGQLIKGSGYLVQQKGKLIASGGDAVTNAGKNIVASAHLVTPDHGSGYSSGGHGGSSFGHSLGNSLGNSFSGLTKTITSLSAGSSSGITSASGASSSAGSSHSSGHASGHSDDYSTHGNYDAVENDHGITYTHSFDDYDKKPVTYASYGPPKSSVKHIEPHAIYGTPEHNDGTYKFAETHSSFDDADMLSEILKNIPHKPMKTVGHVYTSGISVNQYPIPNNVPPPPFKPLKDYPSSYDTPVYSPHAEYGAPTSFYSSPNSDFSSLSSKKESVVVDPKAYNAYHSMKLKLSKPQTTAASLPGPVTIFDGIVDSKGLEIQKSIGYEISAR